LRSISIDIAIAGIFPLANSAVWDIFGIKNCGAEIGPMEIGLTKIGPTEIGLTEIGPTEIGPTEIDPTEIGPTEIGPTDISPMEIGPTKINPMEIGHIKIGPMEIGPMKIGLTKIGPTEIGLTEIGPTEIGPTEIDTIEIGPMEIGLMEIGPIKIGRMEIGPTEISPMEIGPMKFKPLAAFLVIEPQFMAGDEIIQFRLIHSFLHAVPYKAYLDSPCQQVFLDIPNLIQYGLLMDEPLKRIIQSVGGMRPLARSLGISPQAVAQWRHVPAKHVLAIETIINAEVTRYEMRPDIYGVAP